MTEIDQERLERIRERTKRKHRNDEEYLDEEILEKFSKDEARILYSMVQGYLHAVMREVAKAAESLDDEWRAIAIVTHPYKAFLTSPFTKLVCNGDFMLPHLSDEAYGCFLDAVDAAVTEMEKEQSVPACLAVVCIDEHDVIRRLVLDDDKYDLYKIVQDTAQLIDTLKWMSKQSSFPPAVKNNIHEEQELLDRFHSAAVKDNEDNI